ncbi:MAG: hypothetical protein A2297_08960 [Elusimicrobia bacterium RIFOXYB2_FULL_48_7]|nr:MAG: hypothetical protein A2297_08960 [Elusimicrobia bacterium RIFOXYB2_FULL_48_7]
MKNTAIGLSLVVFIQAACFSVELTETKYNAYLHFLLGEISIRQNDFSRAQYELEQTIKLDRSAVNAYKDLIYIYLQSGKLEEARLLARTLKNLSDNANTKLFLGGYYVFAGDTASAVAQYEDVLKNDSDNSECLVILAGIYSETNPEKSISYWDRYISLNPDSAEAYYRKSAVLRKLKRPEEAKSALEKAVEVQPSDLLSRITLADIYQNEENYARAAKELDECTEFDKGNYSLYIRAGELYTLAKDYDNAKKVFERALAQPQGNKNPILYFWLALLYENDKDWENARLYIEKSIELKPDTASFIKLGYYYTQMNSVEKALKVLTKASSLDPKNAEVNFFLGLGYIDMGKTGKAEKCLLKAVNLNPEMADAHYYLATLYEQSGKFKKALPHLRKVIELNPKNAVALNFLGYAMADRGINIDEAEGLIEKALELDPGNAAYTDSLGWVYYKQGKYAEAKKEIEKASRDLKDPVITEHLGDVEKALGNTESALKLYKRVLFLDPGNKVVKKKLKQLEK